MTVTVINIGNLPNDGTGDSIRSAFNSVNTSLLTLDSQNYFNQRLFTSNLVNGQVFYITSIVANNTITADSLVANTVSFSGTLTVSNTTTSVSSTTGALTVAGGLGVAGTSHFGADVYVDGTIHGTIAAGSSSFTNIDNTPIGISIPRAAKFLTVIADQAVTINDATATTSYTTGALTVVGGISTRANLYASNYVVSTNVKADYLTVNNRVVGSLYLTGADNIYINGSPVATSAAAFVGGIVPGQARFTSVASSTNTSTGAVVVSGGVGIGGNLNVAGQIIAGGQFVDQNGVRVADIGLFPNNTVTGTMITSAQPNITSVGTLLGLTLGGNLDAGLSNQYRIGSVASPFLQVYGTRVTAQQLDGVLQTPAQPQVTSLGTLTALTSSGNITAANLIATSAVYAPVIGRETTTLVANLINTSYGTIANVTMGNVYVQNSTVGNSVIASGVITNFSTANAVITGGSINIANGTINLGEINNFSSPNVYIFGGYITNMANVRATEGRFTNLSSGNVLFTGGYLDNVPVGANVKATGAFTTLTADTVTAAGTVRGANVKVGTLTYSDSGVLGVFQSSINSYNQFVLQNSSAGSSASSDYIVNNDISTASTHYGDFGINGSNYAGTGSLAQPNNVYLTATTGDLVLGTTTSNFIRFVVNSGATDAVQIGSNGNLVAMSGVDSSSVTTGALVVAGGVGISYNLNVGQTAVVRGNIVAASGAAAVNTTSGALVVRGGAGISGSIITGGNVVITSTDDVTDGPGYAYNGALLVAGGAGIAKSMIVYGDLTVKGAIQATQSVSSTYSGLSIFNAGIIATTVRSPDIGNVGAILTGTLTAASASQANITTVGTLTGLTSAGNIVAASGTASTNTTSGALVVVGGAGISGVLNIGTTGDVSANIGKLFNGNITTNANLGAYQTWANANVASIQNQIFASNANIGSFYTYANATFAVATGPSTVQLSANLGAYQTFANANVSSLQNQITGANTNIQTTNANLGAFQTWSNANVSSLQNQITGANTNIQTTNANLGAYQTFANANAASQQNTLTSLQNQITGANTNIQTTSANLGSYQTFANANVSSLQNQITGANTNIQTTNANLGAYQTYANANITAVQANLGTVKNDITSIVTAGNANTSAYLAKNTVSVLNFSTANAVITGGYAQGLANVRATEAQFTNLSSGNAVITGGYINNVANVVTTGNTVVGANLLVGYTTLATVPVNSAVVAGHLGVGTSTPGYTIEALGGAHVYGAQINTIAVPAAATGSLSSTGGNLPGATVYSVQIVAVDDFGLQSLASGYSNQSTASGATSSIAYTWSAIPGAASYRIYVYTGASPVLSGYFTSVTNSYILTTVSGILTNTQSFGGAGNLLIRSAAVSTSTTTGALVVVGGVGVAGNVNAGSVSSNNTNSQSAGNVLLGAATIAAAVFNGNSGAISMDDSGQKRISWNDGGGNFNIRTGNYYNGTTLVYTKGAFEANGGATSITMNTDNTNGSIAFNTANIAWPGNTVTWGSTINHTPQYTQFVYNGAQTAIINSEPNSTSTGTGALVVTGGVGISGNLNLATTGDVSANIGTIIATTNSFYAYANTKIGTNTNSNLVVGSTTSSSSKTTGALVVGGGIGAGGAIYSGANVNVSTGGGLTTDQNVGYLFNEGATTVKIGGGGVTKLDNTTVSSSTTSGALQVAGGVGIGGALWIRNTGDVSANIGALVLAGSGTGSTAGLFYTYANTKIGTNTNSNLVVVSTTASTNTTTGALVVGGGAGIAGAININSANNDVAIGNGGTNGSGSIGASGAAFGTIYAKATSAQYADLAENYVADRTYEPGTVVVLGGDQEITETNRDHDPRVAGVISTNPAYLMNSETPGLPVALMGRVPCMVVGPISKGDLLVTSRLSGVAQKLDPTRYQPGCIIGKSLENISVSEIKTIEILVGRL